MSIADVGIKQMLQYCDLGLIYKVMCDTNTACDLPDTDFDLGDGGEGGKKEMLLKHQE